MEEPQGFTAQTLLPREVFFLDLTILALGDHDSMTAMITEACLHLELVAELGIFRRYFFRYAKWKGCEVMGACTKVVEKSL